MKTLVALIGLVLILEGLPYATFPEAMLDWLRRMTVVSPGIIRGIGAVAVLLGLLLCFISQRTTWFG